MNFRGVWGGPPGVLPSADATYAAPLVLPIPITAASVSGWLTAAISLAWDACPVSDEKPPDLLSSLPRSRPHRRSDKRAAKPAGPQPPATEQGPPDPPKTPRPRTAAANPAAAKRKHSAAAGARAKAPSRAQGKRSPAAQAKSSPRRAKPNSPRLPQPAQPPGTPKPAARGSQPEHRSDPLSTAVQAAAELAEIGLSVGTRALRQALSRLPRP